MLTNSISCNLAGRAPNAIRSIETAGVNHAHWCGGCVAARGAGTALGRVADWVSELGIARAVPR